MFAPETAETTDFKHCQGCGTAQIARDKFCRRCGMSQRLGFGPMNYVTAGVVGDGAGRADRYGCETRPLPACGTLRRSYSGRLVGIVTQGVSERTLRRGANHWARLLISMLVAVPLWLMIVLLSPLDAYVAAKDLGNQI